MDISHSHRTPGGGIISTRFYAYDAAGNSNSFDVYVKSLPSPPAFPLPISPLSLLSSPPHPHSPLTLFLTSPPLPSPHPISPTPPLTPLVSHLSLQGQRNKKKQKRKKRNRKRKNRSENKRQGGNGETAAGGKIILIQSNPPSLPSPIPHPLLLYLGLSRHDTV